MKVHGLTPTLVRFLVCAALAVLARGWVLADGDPDLVSLAGRWRFQIDRQDVGRAEAWFKSTLTEHIQLPGAMAEYGKGDDVTVDTAWTGGIVDKSWFTAPEMAKYREPGRVKVPFWLQPSKHYVGAAWYQREVNIPRKWEGQRVVLTLERPHWETRVWLDDRFVGSNNSLSTPHEYDLGAAVAPGRHTLTIRVDNRLVIDVGHDSHSVSDHTQGNWNGIVGKIVLRATPAAWIDDLQIVPSVKERRLRVRVVTLNPAGRRLEGKLSLFLEPGAGAAPIDLLPVSSNYRTGGTNLVDELEMLLPASVKLWDEFTPALYRLRAELRGQADGREMLHEKQVTFGLREFSTDGTQFTINGRKTFIRGTLECCIFPRTGYPPTEVKEWKRLVHAAKAHGLNNLRFHSWCPPEAAFTAADELGMYLHVEVSSWANSDSSLGDGRPVDAWLYTETDRILKTYGNHPSFMLMPYGNEPGGKNHAAFLAKWVEYCKAKDPRRLYTSGAGWPQIPENQWHSTPDPRIQAWGGGLKSRINALPPETRTDYREYIRARTVPVVSHEIGQWCVYPNFEEMRKYTGYLTPRNFEIFRDTLRAHGMMGQARDFLLASGKLQTLCYKEDIESALRTPDMGGFQLLDLHDFPGQGTALVGVLDPFWEPKGYVTAKEYSRFCNSTVPLALLTKRVFTSDEALEADIEVAHFGNASIEDAVVSWRLLDDAGRSALSGRFPARTIAVGDLAPVGQVRANLATLPTPARYRLVVGLAETRFENDWDIWVYPRSTDVSDPAGVTIVNELDDAALASLNNGGRVLLMIPPDRVRGDPKLGKVALGFSSIFWNTAWTGRQPPHTLGILCDPKHPALAGFPTEFHSNWQWWYLVSQAGAMILDDLPPKLQPTVQVIDDWFTARKLALVFEAKVGKGRLLVCSIDLKKNAESNPVARQMLRSLLCYVGGTRFDPKTEVGADALRHLVSAPSVMRKHGAKIVRASSAEPGYEAGQAIDGNPQTIWHTAWTGGEARFPHEIEIGFADGFRMSGFTLLPRQDDNRNGWIKDYVVWVSDDGSSWGEPMAQGSFGNDSARKTVEFAAPKQGRFLRVVANSGHGNGPWASVAELEVLEAR